MDWALVRFRDGDPLALVQQMQRPQQRPRAVAEIGGETGNGSQTGYQAREQDYVLINHRP